MQSLQVRCPPSQLYASIALATCSLAPFPFACHNFFILSVCSSFSAPKPRFIFIPLLLYIIKLLFYLHVFKLACYALKIHRLSSLLSAVLCLAFLVGPRPLQLQHILRPLFHSLGIKALHHPTLSVTLPRAAVFVLYLPQCRMGIVR